jgi:hypothetical protein
MCPSAIIGPKYCANLYKAEYKINNIEMFRAISLWLISVNFKDYFTKSLYNSVLWKIPIKFYIEETINSWTLMLWSLHFTQLLLEAHSYASNEPFFIIKQFNGVQESATEKYTYKYNAI